MLILIRHIFAALLLMLPTAAMAVNLFAVCTTTCIWDASTTMWSLSSGGATGAGPPGSNDAVILDTATCVGGTTCTITVNTTVNVSLIQMGTCTASTSGCILDFSTHNNNITLNSFSATGTGKRQLNMGNGTWIIQGAAPLTIWNIATSTNMILNANGSTLNLVGPTGTTAGAIRFQADTNARIYNNIRISGSWYFLTSFDASSLTIAAPAFVGLPNFTTTTISTTFAVTGSSASNPVGFASDSPGALAALILPTASTMSWVSLRDMEFAGSGSVPVATNSFNLQNNRNITISGPSGGLTACILGGWLLWRDMPEHINDNFPAWLDKAA